MSVRLAGSLCPNCGAKLNAAAELTSNEMPHAGDVTVCMYCSSVLLYSDNMMLCAPNIERLLEVLDDQRVVDAIKTSIQFRKMFPEVSRERTA